MKRNHLRSCQSHSDYYLILRDFTVELKLIYMIFVEFTFYYLVIYDFALDLPSNKKNPVSSPLVLQYRFR